MGEVFRAHDPVLNRAVAVKRISAGLDADEMVRKRFQREAQSAALLSHPNIITVYELGFEGDQLFMAMELLDGVDLKHAIAARQMTLDEKIGVVQQICEGLAFAHAHDIVHRDLKPANIHILPSGKVKIMDFGLARLSGSEMTTTGMVMGTPHYMSPEQVKGQKADARSDIFALGCVFYELLAGHKPFDAESMHGVLYKIMQEEPIPVREAAPGTPEALAHIVEKALAKNPDERFPNAGDLLVALRQARSVSPAGRGPERSPDLERAAAAPAARPAPRRAGGEHVPGVLPEQRAPDLAGRLPAGAPDRPGAGRPRDRRRGLGAAKLRPRPAGPAARTERRGRQPHPQGHRLAGRGRAPPPRRGQLPGRRAGGGARPEARPAERRGAAGPRGGRRRPEGDRRRGRGGPARPRPRATASGWPARPSTS